MEQLQETPSCPNLSTLLIRVSWKLRTISSEFFQYMPVIRVLDLSRNYELTELPVGIGKLISLEYLNLSDTSIAELPIELKNLTKLRCLLVAHTDAGLKIPRELLLSLSSLQLFDIYGSGISEKELVEELFCLEHLMEVSISLNNAIAVQSLQNSCKLQSCIRRLSIFKHEGTWSLTSLKISSFKHLEVFHLQMEGMQICASPDNSNTKFRIIWNHYHHNLREIHFSKCHSLLDLTCLIYAPSLQYLFVANCNSIEEIVKENDVEIEKEEEENVEGMLFSRLTTLYLMHLPSLKSIYGQVLPFSSLVEIFVDDCPNLRKLPFDSNSAKSIKKIQGKASWWDGLQWEDAAIQSHFRPYFREWI
uniref:Uncharacterized protein n=1 Tax=Davidia involucrata TaxID=16924 RepID=A0A5B7BNC0_DAVIN